MVDKFSADTVSVTDSPSPYKEFRPWTNGVVPYAEDFNREWRDGLSWLLGDTSPSFEAVCTTAVNITVSNPIPWNTESYKRGGIIHEANSTRIFIPQSAWYSGIIDTAWDSTAAGVTHARWVKLLANGSTQKIYCEFKPRRNDDDQQFSGIPFVTYLRAGDYIELYAGTSLGSGSTVSTFTTPADFQFRISLWFSNVQNLDPWESDDD